MHITTSIFKIGLLITATQFFLSSGCNKNSTRPCPNAPYSFAVTCNYSPENEIYSIGDTLNLTSVFSKMLHNQANQGTTVDYSNSTGIGGNIFVYKTDTISHTLLDAINNFNYFSVKGTLTASETKPLRIKDVFFQELSSTYEIKIGMVAREKGIFVLYVSDMGSKGIIGKNCTNAGFSMTVTNTDKHIGLYQYAMQQIPDEIQKKNMYCFRVQ